MGKIRKNKNDGPKTRVTQSECSSKTSKKRSRLDFCGFFTGCPEVMGACDFNGLRYLQTIDATTGWVEFRVGSFGLTHRGFLCWGVLTSWFGVFFWPEWFFRCLKWKIHLWNLDFESSCPNFCSSWEYESQKSVDKQRIWDFAAKNWLPNGIFGGALLLTFSDFF